jgi:hypothetical protein
MEREHPQHLWGQFARLGEMMGDGLHYESDGKWITKEYKRLMLLLCPDIKEAQSAQKKIKNAAVDEKIKSLIAKKPCPCGGNLTQSRSGSLILNCDGCKKRFKAVTSKNK